MDPKLNPNSWIQRVIFIKRTILNVHFLKTLTINLKPIFSNPNWELIQLKSQSKF